VTYLITFACYGCHLHGDEFRVPSIESISTRREVVMASLLDHCSHRNWSVLVAHVRSSHVHIVVESEAGRSGS